MPARSLKMQMLTMIGLAAGALAIAADPASAGRSNGVGTVMAKSAYGNQTVSGMVRPGPYGYQVRLPGGTWLDCGGDCQQKLREETVDFWQKFEERSRGRR